MSKLLRVFFHGSESCKQSIYRKKELVSNFKLGTDYLAFQFITIFWKFLRIFFFGSERCIVLKTIFLVDFKVSRTSLTVWYNLFQCYINCLKYFLGDQKGKGSISYWKKTLVFDFKVSTIFLALWFDYIHINLCFLFSFVFLWIRKMEEYLTERKNWYFILNSTIFWYNYNSS